MGIERMVYVTCDRCLKPAELGDNAHEARIYAQREGFIRLAKEKLDLCPECALERGVQNHGKRPRKDPS